MPATIIEADSPETLSIVKQHFAESAASLEVSLGFQHFDEELAGLPGITSGPPAAPLVAWRSARPRRGSRR